MFYVNTKKYYPKNDVPAVASIRKLEYYAQEAEKCKGDKEKYDELVKKCFGKENKYESI